MPEFNSTEAVKKFYAVMKKGKNNLCAAYLIGNIINCDKKYNLEEIKLKIVSKEIKIEALWKAIISLSPDKLILKSKTNQASLTAFKKWILEDIDLLKAIGKDNLIDLATSEANYARIVFIALIQEHSIENNEAFIGFNYTLITQGSAEHTYLYVRETVSKCADLPVELIKLLGESNPKIAKDILYDLPPNHKDTPEIVEFFYIKYEALRPKVVLEKIKATKPAPSLSLSDKIYNILVWFFTKIKSVFYYFSDKKTPVFSEMPQNNIPDPIIEIVVEPVKIEVVNKDDVRVKNRTKNRIPSRHNRARNLP